MVRIIVPPVPLLSVLWYMVDISNKLICPWHLNRKMGFAMRVPGLCWSLVVAYNRDASVRWQHCCKQYVWNPGSSLGYAVSFLGLNCSHYDYPSAPNSQGWVCNSIHVGFAFGWVGLSVLAGGTNTSWLTELYLYSHLQSVSTVVPPVNSSWQLCFGKWTWEYIGIMYRGSKALVIMAFYSMVQS